MDPSVLARKPLTELKSIAAHLEMRGYQRLKKAELIEAITRAAQNGGDGQANASNGHGRQMALDDQPAGGQRAAGTRTRTRKSADDGDEAEAKPAESTADDSGADGETRTRTRTRKRNDEDEVGEGPTQTDAASAGTEPQRAQDDGEQRGDREQRARAGGDQASDDDAESADRAHGERPARTRDDQDRGETKGGGEQNRGEQNRGEQNRSDGNRGEQNRGDGDGKGRRRSRRERRRNKGGGGGGQPQQQRQGGRQDDDPNAEPGEVRTGVLDILPEGYGFLRTSGYLPGDRDVYVSQSQVRRHGLRRGDIVEGPIRQQRNSDKVPALHHVQTVNGNQLDAGGNLPHRPDFKDMTPLFPDERLRLETPDGPISMRIIDLMSPIGKGQRGLIVSPPKAGKTTILKELGQAIAYNNPECHVMVVLVDERPEEVTDMQRSVPGEVIASTFDRPADDHTQIAELAIERAKRLVEQGRDVVILLDSITRLSRAYNLAAPASGRIMSGGVDSTALYPPKRFFGAARNIEGGGSLTIVASALIETGSKMDEVIFEEFKGTGNMELRLDRRLEQKRIFPAIDIEASGTRKEELLLDKEELTIIWKLRRVLHALEGPGALELLIDKMKTTKSNNQFLIQIQKSNLQT
jgi:transcription termination factor Rho